MINDDFRSSPRVRSVVPLTLLAALVLLMPGCKSKVEGGLLLEVTIEAGVRANCLVVDSTNSDGNRVTRSFVARDPQKSKYFVGISQGDFPKTLTWQASTQLGRCDDETSWKLTSRSSQVTQTFPDTGVTTFALTIGQPDATLDGDRDTYVDVQKNGTDCDDTNSQVNPGAPQICNQAVDTNCNGKLFCADPSCANDPTCLTQPTTLAFETMLPTLGAGDCSGEVVVQTLANGRPAAVGATTLVNLMAAGAPATTLEFFSDTSCLTPMSARQLTLGFGVSRASFSFRARTSGSLAITASAMDLGSAQLMTEVTDQPVHHLTLTPARLSTRAGACSSAFTVTAQDVQNRPTNATAGLPLAVSFLPNGTNSVTTYTDANCAIAGTPSIGSGTSSTTFYVKGVVATGAMPLTVQVSSPSVNNGMPTTAELVVTAGDAVRMAFTSPTTGVANTTCGAMPLELQLLDGNGNVAPAPATGLNVALTFVAPPTTGTLEFFSGPGCTGGAVSSVSVAGGSSSAFISVRAMGAGLYTVTATSTLTTPTATTQVSVATMNPTALVFPSPTTVIQSSAGVCSPGVRVQTRESNSLTAAVSPLPADVLLTIAPSIASSVQLFRDSSCTMGLGNPATLTMRGGTSEQLFYFRADVARALSLSVSAAAGSGLSATSPEQLVRIVPGPTTRLTLAPLTLSAAAGACSTQVSIVSTDAFDNPTSPTGPVTLSANPSLTAPMGVAFSQVPGCSPTGNTAQLVDGGAFFYATAQRAQTYSLGATAGAASSVAPVVFSVDAGSPASLVVITQPPATLAAGSCATVTVERRDAFGNPAPGGPEPLTVTPDTASVLTVHGDTASCMSSVAGAPVAFAAGQTRATFAVRGRLAGSSTLTVSSTLGSTSVMTSSVMVTPSAANRLRVATAPPASTAVGACTTVVVERIDVEGNLTGLPNPFNATASATGPGASGLLLAAGSTCGTTAATSVPLAFAAASSARFSFDARTLGALTFDVNPVMPSTVTPTSATTTVVGGNVARVRFVAPVPTMGAYDTCQNFGLEALDVGNNLVTSATSVTLSSNASGTFFPGGCGQPSGTTLNLTGSGTVGYTPLALGSVTLTASASGATPGTATLSISAGTEAALQRSPGLAMNTTAGTCTTFTVTRVDSGGNPAGGPARTVTATLSGVASTGSFDAQLFEGMGCGSGGVSVTRALSIGAGASTVQFSLLVRKAGALTLALTSPAAPAVTLPMDVSTNVVAGSLTAITFTTTQPTSLLANVCSPAVTVQGDDGNGNPVALGNQALSMPGATFSTQSDCVGGTITGLTGAGTSATFYFVNSTPGTPTLRVGTAPFIDQQWTIVTPMPTQLRWKPGALPPASLARFTCSSAIRVQSVDGSGVPTATVGSRVLGFTVVPVGLRFFSDMNCLTPISATFGIAAGQSETPDFFLAGVATTSHTLTATDTSSTGALGPTATVPVDITGAGTPALTVTTASSDLFYKGCLELTIGRAVGATNITFGSTTVNLTLSGTGAPGATFHATNDCSDVGAPTASVVIPNGSSTALAYVRGRSIDPPASTLVTSGATAAALTVGAADQAAIFSSGTSASIAVHPAVRRGRCALTGTSAACTITPPLPTASLNQAFFTYQAVLGTGPSDSSVTCVLNSTTDLTCSRSGNSGQVEVRWQLVSMASGLSVAHYAGSIASGTTGPVIVDAGTAALTSTSEAFVLFGMSTTGGTFNQEDQATAELTGPATVTLSPATGVTWTAARYSVQVVKLAGVTVDHGALTSTMPNPTSFSFTASAPPSSTSQALLFSQRTGANVGSCASRLRGVVNNGNELVFTRQGCSNASFDSISWQRLSVANSVATVDALPALTITTGSSVSTPLPDAGVFGLDRVWTFVGGQGPSGQGGGETGATSLGMSMAYVEYISLPDAGLATSFVRSGTGSTSVFGAYQVSFPP